MSEGQPEGAGERPAESTVVVRFRVAGQIAQLDANRLELERDDLVIVETDRGPMSATILLEPEPARPGTFLPKVLRVANEQDQRVLQRNRVREQEAFRFCQERIRALAQPMKLISVELALSGTRATFYFTSAERVDFRNLVKNLARRFHTRIEMRQIGVRDAARHTGGIGVCGRELCCSTWLPSFKPVSIRMAKDQNLALNHDKLSGVCGRLRCCLRYEQEIYQEARRGMPKLGKRVITPHGEGRVKDLNVLERMVGVQLTDGGYVEVSADEVSRPPEPHQRQRPPRALTEELAAADVAAGALVHGARPDRPTSEPAPVPDATPAPEPPPAAAPASPRHAATEHADVTGAMPPAGASGAPSATGSPEAPVTGDHRPKGRRRRRGGRKPKPR